VNYDTHAHTSNFRCTNYLRKLQNEHVRVFIDQKSRWIVVTSFSTRDIARRMATEKNHTRTHTFQPGVWNKTIMTTFLSIVRERGGVEGLKRERERVDM